MRAVSSVVHAPPRAREWRPPRTLTSLLARVRAHGLDRALCDGVAPWHSPEHAARSLQLTGRRSRNSLARSLELLVARAELSRRELMGSAVIPPCREQVHGALPQILRLATRLRSGAPIHARGVAALRALLCDGTGPAYCVGDRGALARALDEIARWLDTEE